jgi:hypothetical protein
MRCATPHTGRGWSSSSTTCIGPTKRVANDDRRPLMPRWFHPRRTSVDELADASRRNALDAPFTRALITLFAEHHPAMSIKALARQMSGTLPNESAPAFDCTGATSGDESAEIGVAGSSAFAEHAPSVGICKRRRTGRVPKNWVTPRRFGARLAHCSEHVRVPRGEHTCESDGYSRQQRSRCL